jgi:hypothetical protein
MHTSILHESSYYYLKPSSYPLDRYDKNVTRCNEEKFFKLFRKEFRNHREIASWLARVRHFIRILNIIRFNAMWDSAGAENIMSDSSTHFL